MNVDLDFFISFLLENNNLAFFAISGICNKLIYKYEQILMFSALFLQISIIRKSLYPKLQTICVILSPEYKNQHSIRINNKGDLFLQQAFMWKFEICFPSPTKSN